MADVELVVVVEPHEPEPIDASYECPCGLAVGVGGVLRGELPMRVRCPGCLRWAAVLGRVEEAACTA